MYLLDTNICIYIIKKKPKEVLKKLKSKRTDRIFISSLTIAELEYGVEKSQHKDKNKFALLEFLSIYSIIFFDDKDAVTYGKIRTQLEQIGKPISEIDMLLAAQAVRKNLIFVTNNMKEFERVDNLQVENWAYK